MSTWTNAGSDSFFSKQRNPFGLLWLPPLSVSHFTQDVDWLSGLTLSHLFFRKKKNWSIELANIIESENLHLDKDIPLQPHTLIKLPAGFKCSTALIMDHCKWESPDEVFSQYSRTSKKLNPDQIQSPYIWKSTPSQLLKEVQWIKI